MGSIGEFESDSKLFNLNPLVFRALRGMEEKVRWLKATALFSDLKRD